MKTFLPNIFSTTENKTTASNAVISNIVSYFKNWSISSSKDARERKPLLSNQTNYGSIAVELSTFNERKECCENFEAPEQQRCKCKQRYIQKLSDPESIIFNNFLRRELAKRKWTIETSFDREELSTRIAEALKDAEDLEIGAITETALDVINSYFDSLEL